MEDGGDWYGVLLECTGQSAGRPAGCYVRRASMSTEPMSGLIHQAQLRHQPSQALIFNEGGGPERSGVDLPPCCNCPCPHTAFITNSVCLRVRFSPMFSNVLGCSSSCPPWLGWKKNFFAKGRWGRWSPFSRPTPPLQGSRDGSPNGLTGGQARLGGAEVPQHIWLKMIPIMR